jgi:hypothetical protein
MAKYNSFYEGFTVVVIGTALFVGLAMLMAYPTKWFINYLFTAQLLTYVLGAAKITFWKAFVFNALFGGLATKSSSSSKD